MATSVAMLPSPRWGPSLEEPLGTDYILEKTSHFLVTLSDVTLKAAVIEKNDPLPPQSGLFSYNRNVSQSVAFLYTTAIH